MESKNNYALPAALIIMDGFGMDAPGPGNAITLANTPVLSALFENRPMVYLEASGEAVGLPEGQMGNSEVGHLNIGAGRVVYQELTRINMACEDGSLEQIPELIYAYEQAKAEGCALHLMGLLSDGGVHSNNTHLYALMRMAGKLGVSDVRVHAFLDGRDVPPSSGKSYLLELENVISELAIKYPKTKFSVESVMGRYYSMDRDKRWDRVRAAYDAIVNAQPYQQTSAIDAIQNSYNDNVTDEFVVPINIGGRGVKEGDSVVFFNFRPDRARELSHAFVDSSFEAFPRNDNLNVNFVCLTEYEAGMNAPIAFKKEFPQNVLADVIANANLRQLHIAETEKYAHVTFFLNGGREEEKPGEQRILIPSPKVATYDLQPEMSAFEVCEALCDAIKNDAADIYIVNFANCDMVGHTGIIPAAVSAVEAVDTCVGRVLIEIAEKHGVALLTADHGNADKMIAEDGTPHTAHTTAQVPLVLIDYANKDYNFGETTGALCDIAPTLIAMTGLKQPSEMLGKSLLA